MYLAGGACAPSVGRFGETRQRAIERLSTLKTREELLDEEKQEANSYTWAAGKVNGFETGAHHPGYWLNRCELEEERSDDVHCDKKRSRAHFIPYAVMQALVILHVASNITLVDATSRGFRCQPTTPSATHTM